MYEFRYIKEHQRAKKEIALYEEVKKMSIRQLIKYLCPFLLIIVIVLLTVPGINKGEFWWSDESRHAMDGVFIMDLLTDSPPLTDLYRYTEIYFAKYPALALTWYPPFFAFVESLFFRVFGISEMVARLTVIFFTLLAVIFLYIFIKKASNEIVAFLSCLLFITTPVVILWARSVMLELPIMALIILSCYFFYNYFFLNKPRHIYYLTLAITLALYTKQTAAFIIPVFFSWILFQKQFKKLFDKQMLICIILFALMILPLVIFNLKFGTVGFDAILKDAHTIGGQVPKMFFEHWIITFNIFVHTFILPIRILIVLSIGVFIFDIIKNKKLDNMMLFLFLWVFWWYIAFSYVVNLNGDFERCCIYVIPAIAALVIWPIIIYKDKMVCRIMIMLILIISAYQGFLSYNQIRQYTSGYKQAARYVMDNYDGKTILFGGYFDGNFIFNVRKYDKDRKAIVLRDSKVLANWSVYPEWGYTSYINSERDIYEILNKYGTKYIVVEDKEIFNKIPFRILRDVLKKGDFTLEKTIKVRWADCDKKKISILIYKYKKEPMNLSDNLIIDFPLLKRKINVPLKSLSTKGLK